VLPREHLAFDLLGEARTRLSAGAVGVILPPAVGVVPDDGVTGLGDSGAGLRLQVRASPTAGRLSMAGAGARLSVAGIARAVASGRVLRVDGEMRTLWAGRD
jgi:hypothetical protein